MSPSMLSTRLRLTMSGRGERDLDIVMPMSFFDRARGLLGRGLLGAGRGMLFERCASVHCIGMTRSIDVVFAARDGQILKCVPALRPFGAAACRGAYYVLELDAGGVERLGVSRGDRIELLPK